MNLILVASRILGIYFLIQAVTSIGYTCSFFFNGMLNPEVYFISNLILIAIFTISSLVLILLPFGLRKLLTRNIPQIDFSSIDESVALSVGIKILGIFFLFQGITEILSYLVGAIVGLGLHENKLYLRNGKEIISLITHGVTGLVGLITTLRGTEISRMLLGNRKKSDT